MNVIGDARRGAFAGLRVAAREPLSKWIEANVRLPEGVCAAPGPVRLYPYQKGVADALADPELERVTVLKATRIGYTALLASFVANLVANDPSAILVLQPAEADARDFVVSDLEPLLAASGLDKLTEILRQPDRAQHYLAPPVPRRQLEGAGVAEPAELAPAHCSCAVVR